MPFERWDCDWIELNYYNLSRRLLQSLVNMIACLCSYPVLGAELVDEPFGVVGLLDNALLAVLPDGPTQLVVVHGRPVLSRPPQPGDAGRILNFEDPLGSVQPADTVAIAACLQNKIQDHESKIYNYLKL